MQRLADSALVTLVRITFRKFGLKLSHRWTIANTLGPGGSGGTDLSEIVLLELKDKDGNVGIGETAPSTRYAEDVDTSIEFYNRIDAEQLSFRDVARSMQYLDSVASGNFAAKCGLNLALLDGAARSAGKSVYDFMGLGFTEGKHTTSFSIGIDEPDLIRKKTIEAAAFPILKLKVGSPNDRQNLAALREVSPDKPIRADANEAWKTKEEALDHLEALASDGKVQFVEQPMHALTNPKDLAWLKDRSPLPIMADESYRSKDDLSLCANCFHAVNVKLVKSGGITGAFEALTAARKAGLKTMIGCMIETSLLISAAAHLAELTDYLDIDGNLLISNDPFSGVSTHNGAISFLGAQAPIGLRVTEKSS